MSANNFAVVVLSSSSLKMVAIAFSDNGPTSPNSFMALSGVVNTTTLKSDQHLYNSTVYLVEQDELEFGLLAAFSDVHTVLVTCIVTLLPLILAFMIAVGVRHAWRKYKHRRDEMSDLSWYHGLSTRRNTADSLDESVKLACIGIQPPPQILSAHNLSDGLGGRRHISGIEVIGKKMRMGGNDDVQSPVNLAKNNGGNIITLTEQMISMDDNSFVVEMKPMHTKNDNNVDTCLMNDAKVAVNDQLKFIHQDGIADNPGEFTTTWRSGSINTGLSQSDLSLSSCGFMNREYCYGNQVEYETGHSYNSLRINRDGTLFYNFDGNFGRVEFDDTPTAEGILLNTIEATDSISNTNNNTIINDIHSSNSGHSMTHGDCMKKNNSIDIFKHNRPENCDTSVKVESMLPDNLIDNPSAGKCKILMLTGVLLEYDPTKIPTPRGE